MERDAFGLPMTAPEDDPELGFLKDQPAAPEIAEITTGVKPTEPVKPVQEAPGAIEGVEEVESTEEEDSEAQEGLESEISTEEKPRKTKYAGKYNTIKAFEEGYRNARQLQTRSAEHAKELEDQLTQAQDKMQRYEDTVQRIATKYQEQSNKILQSRDAERAAEFEQRYYEAEQRSAALQDSINRLAVQMQRQQMLAQMQPQAQPEPQTLYDADGNPVQVPTQPQYTPDQIQFLLNQAVNEAMQNQYQQQYAANLEGQEQYNQAANTIQNFYERHPDVYQTEKDNAVYETIQALNKAWEPTGSSLDIGDHEALEIALEASQSPPLQRILEMHPEYIDTDAGMELARFQAGMADAQTAGMSLPEDQALVTQSAPSAPQVAPMVGNVVGQRRPITERASSGNTADTGQDVLDEFAEGVLAFRNEQKGSLAGSVFG